MNKNNIYIGMDLLNMYHQMNKKRINADLFKTKEVKFNIVFKTSKGFEVTLPSPPYITVKELIRNYFRIIGIKDNESLFFIHNAQSIDTNDENSIASVFREYSIITVIEPQLIGT